MDNQGYALCRRIGAWGPVGVHPWSVRWWRSLTLDQRERRRGVMFVGLGVVFAVNGLVDGNTVFRVNQLVCAGLVLVAGVMNLIRHRRR